MSIWEFFIKLIASFHFHKCVLGCKRKLFIFSALSYSSAFALVGNQIANEGTIPKPKQLWPPPSTVKPDFGVEMLMGAPSSQSDLNLPSMPGRDFGNKCPQSQGLRPPDHTPVSPSSVISLSSRPTIPEGARIGEKPPSLVTRHNDTRPNQTISVDVNVVPENGEESGRPVEHYEVTGKKGLVIQMLQVIGCCCA